MRTPPCQAEGCANPVSHRQAGGLDLDHREFRRVGPLLGRLQIDHRSVAFSNMEQRTTVLEEPLFLPGGVLTDKLARDLQVRPDQLVSMAVSHELGHVLCHDASEAAANRVAEQLQNGKNPECGGNGRSLTRMQELLYEQSRALWRAPPR